jgi:hypothetical protein
MSDSGSQIESVMKSCRAFSAIESRVSSEFIRFLAFGNARGLPPTSDEEQDFLRKKWGEIEKEYPDYITLKSSTQNFCPNYEI